MSEETVSFLARIVTVGWLTFIAGFLAAKGHELAKLTPNELADTLAGAFAPLAFAWVVVAVTFQRRDLEAQRRELAANGAALKAQAHHLQVAVGEMQAQSVRVAESIAAARNERLERVLVELSRRVVDSMFFVADAANDAAIIRGGGTTEGKIFGDSAFYVSCRDRDDFTSAAAAFLSRARNLLESHESGWRVRWPEAQWPLVHQNLSTILAKLRMIATLAERAPQETRELFPIEVLPELTSRVTELVSLVSKWLPEDG